MCILIKKENLYHYIIVTKIKNKKIYFLDPSEGKKILDFESFKPLFQNIIIEFKKTSFTFKKKNESNIFMNYKLNLVAAISSLFILIISFLSNFYLKIIMDSILPQNNKDDLLMLTFAFIIFLIFKTLFQVNKNFIIKKMEIDIMKKYYN